VSESGAKEVACASVHHAFGFTCRSGGVEDEEQVFGSDDFGGTVSRYSAELFVPPEVSSFDPVEGVASALEDEYVFDIGAFFEGSVDNGLGRDGLSAALKKIKNKKVMSTCGRRTTKNWEITNQFHLIWKGPLKKLYEHFISVF
jgi:hypothetical protein